MPCGLHPLAACSERRVVKSRADNAFTQAKAELICIRIEEKRGTLMSTELAANDMERVIGAFLTKLCGIAPRLARLCGNSLPVRREIDAIVFETRKELAAFFTSSQMSAMSRR